MSDFNWSENDSDAVVLPYQPRTAVYASRGGGVVVRQEASSSEEYDTEILLTPQGALAVAYRMIEEAHLIGLPSPPLSLMASEELGTRVMMRAAPEQAAPEADQEEPRPSDLESAPLLAGMAGPGDGKPPLHGKRGQ